MKHSAPILAASQLGSLLTMVRVRLDVRRLGAKWARNELSARRALYDDDQVELLTRLANPQGWFSYGSDTLGGLLRLVPQVVEPPLTPQVKAAFGRFLADVNCKFWDLPSYWNEQIRVDPITPESLRFLAHDSRHPFAEVRNFVLLALAEMPESPEVLDLAVRLAGDEDAGVQRRAIRLLRRARQVPASARPALEKVLLIRWKCQPPDAAFIVPRGLAAWPWRYEGSTEGWIAFIGHLVSVEAAQALVECLREDRSILAKPIWDLLSGFPGHTSLKSPIAEWAAHEITSEGSLGDEAAISRLASFANANEKAIDSSEVVSLLVDLAEKLIPAPRTPQLRDGLNKYMRDDRFRFRHIYWGFGKWFGPIGDEALSTLQEDVKHPIEAVRHLAAVALYDLRNNGQALDLLAELVRDEDHEVCRSAVRILGQCDRLPEQGPRVLAETVAALRGFASYDAAAVLSRFGCVPPRLIEDARSKLRSADNKARDQGFDLLQEFGVFAAPAIPDLLLLLDHKDASYRRGACAVLKAVGTPAAEALPALLRLLKTDSDECVRELAAEAALAAGMSPAEYVSAFIEILRSIIPESGRPTRNVDWAVRPLEQCGHEALRAVPLLAYLLGALKKIEKHEATHWAITRIVAQLGPDAAAVAELPTALFSLLACRRPWYQIKAAHALVRIMREPPLACVPILEAELAAMRVRANSPAVRELVEDIAAYGIAMNRHASKLHQLRQEAGAELAETWGIEHAEWRAGLVDLIATINRALDRIGGSDSALEHPRRV